MDSGDWVKEVEELGEAKKKLENRNGDLKNQLEYEKKEKRSLSQIGESFGEIMIVLLGI